MGQMNLGKVRGTMIYTGGYVIGSSASGTVFENTGIEKAYEGDLYINTDNSGDYAGCIYECIKPGNALEATWSYKGNIRGPKTATVNSLKSTSTEDALAAYQGNRLFEMMVDAGVFCKNVIVDYDQVAYGLKVRIDNVDSALIIVADGKEYEYTYTASGTAETTKVSIVLGENIGMPQSGGVVSEIRSDNAYIYTYEITGVSAETVYSKNMDLWNSINEALLSHEVTGTVIDGEETLFMGPIHKFVNGIKKAFYPITHAKAVWFDKANKRTVHDEISELNKKFAFVYRTSDITIGAENRTTITIDISKEGYVPVMNTFPNGIVNDTFLERFELSSNSIIVTIYNKRQISMTLNLSFMVMYEKQ